MNEDNWKHKAIGMRCRTCTFHVVKQATVAAESYSSATPEPENKEIGRCRRNAPTMRGFPAVFPTDWCGEHRLDENKL